MFRLRFAALNMTGAIAFCWWISALAFCWLLTGGHSDITRCGRPQFRSNHAPRTVNSLQESYVAGGDLIDGANELRPFFLNCTFRLGRFE